MCNKLIKFGCFEQQVGKNFDFTATGHYATTIRQDGKTWLGTAKDPVKDQTDFLAQIDYCLLYTSTVQIGAGSGSARCLLKFRRDVGKN